MAERTGTSGENSGRECQERIAKADSGEKLRGKQRTSGAEKLRANSGAEEQTADGKLRGEQWCGKTTGQTAERKNHGTNSGAEKLGQTAERKNHGTNSGAEEQTAKRKTKERTVVRKNHGTNSEAEKPQANGAKAEKNGKIAKAEADSGANKQVKQTAKRILFCFINLNNLTEFDCWCKISIIKRGWRNRQTRMTQTHIGETVRVQVPSLVPRHYRKSAVVLESADRHD